MLDTGATTNLISTHDFDISKLDLAPDKLLKMWNGSPQRSLGQATIKLYNPKTRCQYDAVFDIVSEQRIPMLGVHTSQSMGLVTINEDILERVATVKAHCHGAESCIRRARQSLFWLRMAADIRAAVENVKHVLRMHTGSSANHSNSLIHPRRHGVGSVWTSWNRMDIINN